jgi:hypothetical protein
MKAILGLVGLAVVLSSANALGKCNTAQPSCAGKLSFGPFTDPNLCFSVFQVNQGREDRTDFCLRSGEERTLYVRTGDRFCGVRGDRTPPLNCVRSPMDLR